MSRMLCVLLFAAVYLAASVANAQSDSAATDEERAPAPGEPSGAAAAAEESSQESDQVPDPIANTELGEGTDDVPTPAGDASNSPGAAAPDVKAQLESMRADINRLNNELEKLRQEYTELFMAVSEHATAINNHAEGLAAHTESLKDIETGQQTLATQLQAIASSEGVEGALNVLGNMQLSGEPSRSSRFRLRIHNTTGAEQLLNVNGVAWTVRADEWTYVPIPLGPVTVHRSGRQPLEIAEEAIDWQSDARGYFVNYDFNSHQVEQPENADEASSDG